MDRYRYRTEVLLGPWRATVGEAEADAVRARQAVRIPESGGLYWRIAGRIEAERGKEGGKGPP